MSPPRETGASHEDEMSLRNERVMCSLRAVFHQESPRVLHEPNTRTPDEEMRSPEGDQRLNELGVGHRDTKRNLEGKEKVPREEETTRCHL